MGGDKTGRFFFQLIEETPAFGSGTRKLGAFEFPFERGASVRIVRIFLYVSSGSVEEVTVSLGIKLDRVFPSGRLILRPFFKLNELCPICFDRVLTGSGRPER